MMKMNRMVSMIALTTISGAKGELLQENGRTVGVLTLATGDGDLVMTMDEWDALYRGQVKCWAGIKPLKDRMVAAQRKEHEEQRVAARAEAAAKADQEKAQRRAALEAARAEKAEKKAKGAAKKSGPGKGKRKGQKTESRSQESE